MKKGNFGQHIHLEIFLMRLRQKGIFSQFTTIIAVNLNKITGGYVGGIENIGKQKRCSLSKLSENLFGLRYSGRAQSNRK
jgi:hypothetical protein